MWLLLRTCFGVVVLSLCAYGLFFVDLGGKAIFDHVTDVWGSEVVQEKVALMRDGVRNELEDRLARVAEQQAREALGGGRARRGGHDDIPDDDRLRLEQTLEQLDDVPSHPGDASGDPAAP